MADVTVYGFPQSTYVRTVRMTLAEKGVPYWLEPLMPGAPELQTLHPFGRIPAFRHGELVLFETLAICRYIDEAFDGPPLQPDDVINRAIMTQWVSAIIDSFYPAMMRDYFMHYVRASLGKHPPDRAAIDASLSQLDKAFAVLEQACSHADYLAGDDPTLADYFLLPILGYLAEVPESAERLNAAPHVLAWLARVASRPNAVDTVPPPLPGTE
ncbi:MAG: glutathione S-transferase family protein [Alphaproteobacteria bacterium]|jgi:glutathione S-transferase|nr:glutathione S-transferase family protein [Alphaproteobacteria bacterium]